MLRVTQYKGSLTITCFFLVKWIYLGLIGPPWAGARVCSDAAFMSYWVYRKYDLDVVHPLYERLLLNNCKKCQPVLPLSCMTWTQHESLTDIWCIWGNWDISEIWARGINERQCWYHSLDFVKSYYTPIIASRPAKKMQFWSDQKSRPGAAPWTHTWTETCPKRKNTPHLYEHANVEKGGKE